MLAKFTPLYEFLGGLSIAFIGFKDAREHFSKYSTRKFSLVKKSITKLRQESKKTKHELSKLNQAIENKNISWLIESKIQESIDLDKKIQRFFEINGLKNNLEETKLLKRLFVNGSIVSGLFVFLLLLLAGFEEKNESFCLVLLSCFFIIVLIVAVSFPYLRFLKIFRFIANRSTRKVHIIMRFLGVCTLSVVITPFLNNVIDRYYIVHTITLNVLLILSLLFCLSSILAIIYRYWFYLLVKRHRLRKKVKKYNESLNELKNALAFNLYWSQK